MSDHLEPQQPTPGIHREFIVTGPAEHVRIEDRESLEEIDRDVIVRSEDANGLKFEHRGLLIGAFTMVFISLITFFIPGLNALLGGAFGGFFAKRWKRAFMAAAVASVATPMTLLFLNGWTRSGELNFLSGLGFWGWTALHVVCMFLGAAAGVYSRPLAERRGLGREVTVE